MFSLFEKSKKAEEVSTALLWVQGRGIEGVWMKKRRGGRNGRVSEGRGAREEGGKAGVPEGGKVVTA